MKNYDYYLGIDVSKLTLDITSIAKNSPENYDYQKIDNTASAIKKLIKSLPKHTLLCFEHTGSYGLTLCIELSNAQIDFCMITPLELKRSLGIRRGKTDKSDSKDIAIYSMTQTHKLKLYQLAEDDLLEISLLLNQRENINKSIALLDTTERSRNHPKNVSKTVRKRSTKHLKNLMKWKKEIEQDIKNIINENQTLKEKVNLIKSVPGAGDLTALNILVKTKGFLNFENSRKFACHIGIAPFEYSSGTSIKGRTKVSHIADKKMKALISMAALSAKKHDPEMRAYFNRKVGEGKHKMLVMNNIRNKLIARIFAVINRGTPFVSTHKFAA